MRDSAAIAAEAAVWGPYVSYDDVARFEYGRRLWRCPTCAGGCWRIGWTNVILTGSGSWNAALIEEVLGSEESVPGLDARLQQRGTTLRCVARDIPVVFGHWFG